MLSEQALNKRNWEGKEDILLLELHAAYGPNWTRIAGGMGIRSAKQCRERYTQHLKPGLNRSPISDEEGRQIMRMVSECGQRWAQIARNLGTNRSDNQIKNWWNGAKRKETSKRQEASQEQHAHHHHQYPQDLSPSLGLAGLPERRGVLPPVPLELPFDSAHSRSSPARSYDSERPPSLVSDNGSLGSASCSPVTFSLPPLHYSPPTPPTANNCLPPPSILGHGFGPGPVRRSSDVMQPASYSPRSCYVSTAPTTPVGRASSFSSARWEPYPSKGRRPSTGYYSQRQGQGHESESEKRDKGSLSFLLN
ncbi:Homeodomain-like protein [Corynascus similis CBS 632.67]